jgi:hypothetical protein
MEVVMRAAAGVLAVVVFALAVAAAVSAQARAPTITIGASETTLNVGVSGPLAAGPTRFDVVKSGGDELEITIAALRPGVTLAQFTTALRSGDPESAIELAHIDGGASLAAGQQRRAVTFDLRPNSTYVVLNLSGNRPADWEIVSFEVGGQLNGATAPQADASVRIVDLRFRGAKTLPRNGVVRFENAGWAPHFAVAAPLRRGASTRAIGAALRGNRERRVEQLVNFRAATEPQALITRGAVNYNEVRFPRRGRYVLVCFFDSHHLQGMYRFVRVR